MNLLVVLPILVALGALRLLKAGLLAWMIALWMAIYLTLRYGFAVPIPASVITLYMGITTMALATYVLSSRERFASCSRPLIALVVERRLRTLLIVVVLGLPLLVAARIYTNMSQPLQPPSFARTVHPAPPSEPITVRGQTFDLNAVENPFRNLEKSDPSQFRVHVENGRRVYYQNCVYCHGDNVQGDGLFAHGVNPIPTNFRDSGTIAMLQEGFLFWRIAKGGPGMPGEGGPWESAMPAWENFLTVDEMWDVILFLYDHTGQRPREVEEHAK
ncbi:MAG: cytochrome c [Acidobacteria bacterium]|nr:cytochrome c [Acidobacteriota bacterium]